MKQDNQPKRTAIAVCVALVALGVVGWGIWSRIDAEAALVQNTNEAAVATVSTVTAAQSPATEEIVLPGNVLAEYETPIYARTNGYIKRWYTDIGARVKAGQLLAEIDAPEVDQQLRQAKADLMTAQANSRIADDTAKRVHALLPMQSVSIQQDDEASADAAAKAASVAAAQANVERLSQLVAFERVIAPYDGVVTARETDTGDLINAGSGNGRELFRVADTSKLRIRVQVPQSYAALINPGVTAGLAFPEYPAKRFPAKFARTSEAIDPNARTLLVELELDNADHALYPGGYTDVHFALHNPNPGVTLPANTLLFRAEGIRIATVDDEGAVTLHKVTLGRDSGATVEVTTGIAPGMKVVLNPPAAVVDGQHVRLQAAQAPAKGAKS